MPPSESKLASDLLRILGELVVKAILVALIVGLVVEWLEERDI